MGRIANFFRGTPKAPANFPAGPRNEPVTGLPVGEQVLESPYVAARREWNERYGSHIAQATNWRIYAFASMGLSAVLAIALVKIASQSTVQPWVVEVDKLGQVVAVGPADKAYVPDEKTIRAKVASFIQDARSVTPDPVVQKRWLDSVYAAASPATVSYLNDHYRKSDPFAVARNYMVALELQPPMPLSKDTWQVQWTETTRTLAGQVEAITRWQALVNVSTAEPTKAADLLANPSGVRVEQLTWTQQL